LDWCREEFGGEIPPIREEGGRRREEEEGGVAECVRAPWARPGPALLNGVDLDGLGWAVDKVQAARRVQGATKMQGREQSAGDRLFCSNGGRMKVGWNGSKCKILTLYERV
jgi:hypothetical protein